MKLLRFSIIALGLAITGCTESSTCDSIELQESVFPVASKENVVSLHSIESLIVETGVRTRGSEDRILDVECLTNSESDTILYIYKKPNGGWIMFSSDTRVPPIVAESDKGSFEDLIKIDGAKLWIEAMKEEMTLIKKSSNLELNFSEDEITNNIKFWNAINSPDNFVNEIIKSDSISTLALEKPDWPGHYELTGTVITSETIEQVDRLTTTDWHQHFPYNAYCTLRTDYPDLNAYAGCVAIAGAQMLYFLNQKTGIPKEAPSEAYCNGNINNYTWGQTNYSSSIWSLMNINGIYAAPLIADVGRRVNMKYENTQSGALTRDLVDKVFKPYGIQCEYISYNTEILQTSLLENMPLILRAEDSAGTGGHSFIVDGYKKSRNVIKSTYEWVFDSQPPEDQIVQQQPPKVEYTYSAPYVSAIGMNWGWGESNNLPQSNTWYTLTGDWILKDVQNTYNYTIERHMIYGFKPL